MKLRTTKYIVKEGIVNTYRNTLMSLASIGVVTASMIILGVFLVVTINLGYNTKALKEQPEIQVFCDPVLDDKQIVTIEQSIRNDSRVKEYSVVNKKEAFKQAKEMLGDDQDVLEGLDESIMPVSFIVKLKRSEDSQTVVETFKTFSGVENVRYSQKTIDVISRIVAWIQIGSVVLIVVLLAVSMFIISNTIKLTVFARRKEINIMKYIGATDWFIRWPFVVEGVIIGLVGAVIGFAAISFFYAAVSSKFSESINFIRFVGIREVQLNVIYAFSLVGSVVGALGSIISIRKYLRV